jgi:predicted ATPase
MTRGHFQLEFKPPIMYLLGVTGPTEFTLVETIAVLTRTPATLGRWQATDST